MREEKKSAGPFICIVERGHRHWPGLSRKPGKDLLWRPCLSGPVVPFEPLI
jgi:hypothetical protein